MEGQTKGFVDLLTTLAAVEEIRLNILDDREKYAAGRVGRDAAVGAGNPADEGTCTVIVRTRRYGQGTLPED